VPLHNPSLDDRTFDQLVRAGRSLIPRYGPDWTNHNPSDPGIALMELFAYFTETALYQLNRVPDASIEAFLRLLDICRATSDGEEQLSDAVTRALDDLTAVRRAVTAAEFESLALDIGGGLATPVAATDGSGAASVLVRALLAGNSATHLDVRDPVFREGQPVLVGHEPTTQATVVTAVSESALTVFPPIIPPADYLEAVGRAEFVLYLDQGCAPPGRPDLAPPAALIVVVPDRPGDPAPLPTIPLTDALFRALLQHRVLATRIHVVPAVYVPVTVDVMVTGRPGQGLKAAEVESAVRTWLSPLRGGAGGSGWPFGRAVYSSELNQRIESLDRVDHIDGLGLQGGPPGVATGEGIVIPPSSLVDVRSVAVTLG